MEMACECGYVAQATDEDEFVAAARTHAREVHRVELTAELVLALARSSSAGIGNQVRGTHDSHHRVH
jgi:uncharacterized membrane-anchored protein